MLSRSIFKNIVLRAPMAAPSANFGAFVNHRDTDDNQGATPFEFTEENYKEIDDILSNYPTNYKQSGVLPLLMLAQK